MGKPTERSTTHRQAQEAKQQIASLVKKGYIPLPTTKIGKGTDDAKMNSVNTILAATTTVTDGIFYNESKVAKKVDNVGSKDLGYVEWGSDNKIPNNLISVVANLPYTAAGLKFNIDTVASTGPKPMYKTSRYVSGTLQYDSIPYEYGGEYIQGKIDDLYRAIDTTSSEEVKKRYKTRIKELEADYTTWQKTNQEVTEFVESNDIDLTFLKLIVDDSHMDICFPMFELNQGRKSEQYTPKIVSIKHRSVLCCRLEQMDKYGRINNVYYSNKWRGDDSIDAKTDGDIRAYRAINPETAVADLKDLVLGKSSIKGAKFIIPTYYPSAGSPYYPTPAFWSVFNSRIYNYASTLISDKAIARDNANMWGKIIYVHQKYLETQYAIAGATNSDEKQAVLDSIWKEINTFLLDKNNNGKTLMGYSFIGPDGKECKSYEIVDVPQVKSGADTKSELEEIASVIFFAMETHPQLIGAVPGRGSSSGGTYQRELMLLKQNKMVPRRKRFTRLMSIISTFNEWDKKLHWVIPDMVLTTLDASKTGTDQIINE